MFFQCVFALRTAHSTGQHRQQVLKEIETTKSNVFKFQCEVIKLVNNASTYVMNLQKHERLSVLSSTSWSETLVQLCQLAHHHAC